jgi:membrane protease YdiL (CAAX protease family)
MTELMGPPEKKSSGFYANFDVSVVVALLLAAGFAITLATVGLWEAVRNFAVEAVILGATFWVARQYLPWEDAPRERIKKPRFELAAGLVGYALLVYGAVRLFNGQSAWALLAAGMLIPVAVLLTSHDSTGRYSAAAWGLRMPRASDWVVLAVVAVLVFGISRAADIFLPQGEIAAPAAEALKNFTIGGSLLAAAVLAAVLEELFFRVYLQPRLAAFVSGRWALFWQAVLFSAAYFPLYFCANHYSLPYSVALTMALTNGVLAGYFWRKTGSLPLLILLHLVAFSRFGL